MMKEGSSKEVPKCDGGGALAPTRADLGAPSESRCSAARGSSRGWEVQGRHSIRREVISLAEWSWLRCAAIASFARWLCLPRSSWMS